jgi:nucleoside-diphosphate-sugar epimerase
MKILLTGAGGFIGAAFARSATGHGHQIAGLLIPAEPIPSGVAEVGNKAGGEKPKHEPVWMRGTLDDAPWAELQQFQPDVCVHTAWVTAPGVYLESPENVRFLESSIKFLRKVNELGTNHILSLGTCVEYQMTGQKLSEETTPILPTTTYARCKNDLRLAMEADAKSRGFVFSWGRVFYPYGPREHPARLCSFIIQKLSRGEKLVLKSPDSTKDYIFIEDLADAILTVVEKRFQGSINLGTGTGVTVRQIAQALGQMLHRTDLIDEANPATSDPFDFVVADASRLRGLGWKPRHGLEEGLRKLVVSAGSISKS